jgi:hypothetical protein
MSPHAQDHRLTLSAYMSAVDLEMMHVGQCQAAVRDAKREARAVLLTAVVQGGATTASLARLTGYSRRQISRELRLAASEHADDLETYAAENAQSQSGEPSLFG